MSDPTCPVIESLWAEDAQYGQWLEVWVAVAHAQEQHDAAALIRTTTIDPQRIKMIEAETHHDLNSALRAVQERLPDWAAKWVHHGLTSSDVVDTALCLRITRTIDHYRELVDLRSAYPWSEATKLLARAEETMAVGKISGPVGTHASVSPIVEERALAFLGLRPEPVSTQVVSRGRFAWFAVAMAGIALAFGTRPNTAALLVALENVSLWHERDISHSSAERVYLPQLVTEIDKVLHEAQGRYSWHKS